MCLSLLDGHTDGHTICSILPSCIFVSVISIAIISQYTTICDIIPSTSQSLALFELPAIIVAVFCLPKRAAARGTVAVFF